MSATALYKKLKPKVVSEYGIQTTMNNSDFKSSFDDLPETEQAKVKHQLDEFSQLIAFEHRRSRARARAERFSFFRKEVRDEILNAYTKVHSDAFP